MNAPRYDRLSHRMLQALSRNAWLSVSALTEAAARDARFIKVRVRAALTLLLDCGAVVAVKKGGEKGFSLTEAGRALLAEWDRTAPPPDELARRLSKPEIPWVAHKLRRPPADLEEGEAETSADEAPAFSLGTAHPPAAPLPDDLLSDPRIVPVWYGTNRRPENAADEHDGYGGATDDRMHYGYCTVNVPKRYVKGGSGRGWLGRLIHREQTELELGSIMPLAEADFWSRLASTLGAIKEAPAMLLFVHGFRTTFRAAAESAGQLSYELDLPVALFSWPSRGKLAGYLADEEAARESVAALKDFVRTLAATAAAQGRRLHVIAHSMGNRALLQALHEVALQGAAGGPQIGQVIFAAPDVPQREFLRQLARVAAAPGLTAGHTLYAAKDDLALFASQELHDNPRAGICPPVTTAPNLETVDVSHYNLSVLGHGYCFNIGPVLEDISVVLHGGKFRLRSRATGGGHWVLG